MGGLMPYSRVLARNGLCDGDYDWLPPYHENGFTAAQCQALCGDLRRFERDCRSPELVDLMAERSGESAVAVRAVLEAFLC